MTDKLAFGELKPDYNYKSLMWVDFERTPEEAKANPLSKVKIKTNQNKEIVGIQLGYEKSGESPAFEADVFRRLQEQTLEEAETNV